MSFVLRFALILVCAGLLPQPRLFGQVRQPRADAASSRFFVNAATRGGQQASSPNAGSLVSPDSLSSAPAQQPSSHSPVSGEAVVQSLAEREILRSSALIFSGTVLSVEHVASPALPLPITRIRFRVREAIRGTRPGQVIDIREWGGLWNSGERYRPGENLMLFLYPNSKLGLTSTVAGAAGRFHINSSGAVRIGRQQAFLRLRLGDSPIKVRDFAAAIRRARD